MPAPNDSLRLTPFDESSCIHLIARPQFRIGRSPDHSDLVARFQPESPENEIFTNELGRVHVVGEIVRGHPALRDGNGTDPSINGSTFDRQVLTSTKAMPVRRRGMLTLGELYAIDLVPLFCDPDDFLIEGLPEWRDQQSGVHGAIVFAPRLFEPTLRDAAWIFTRLDFELRPTGGPAWLPPDPGNPAAFLRCNGEFWLINAHLPTGELHVDTHDLRDGDAVPLTTARSLRLGARQYAVEIE
ncbi:MAG: hypothetical protein ABIZ56_10800 [Chthoniobacteraceae bacterium]